MSEKQSTQQGQSVLYQLEGRPPIHQALPMSFQHIFAMFTGNIAPILIIAEIVGNLSSADELLMVQAAMLMSGLATLLQVYPIKIGKLQIGSGLPLVMGTAFAFVPVMSTTAAAFGIPAILGATLAGGIAMVLMGVFIKYLKPLFPPIVVGSVLLAIGMNLLPTGARYFAGGGNPQTNPNFGSWQNLLIGFTVFVIITIINRFGKDMLKNVGLLVGIVAGYGMAACMGLVNFAPVREAAWFGLPTFLPFTPTFHAESILSFAAIFLVLGLETMGNMSGITNGIFDRDPTTQESSGGIIANGLTSQLGALFGAFPSSAFGQNTGIVLMTRVINRFCFALAGIIMVCTSFMPKIGALFSSMPQSVLGGAVITVFAMIFLNGFKMISRDGLTDRNVLMLCVTFGLGYALGLVPEVTAKMPAFVQFIFGDPVTAVCVVSVIANLIFPGRKEDEARRADKNATKQV
ncbi:purine permease [Ruminococcaceae bacterium OttesenSCG-928-A16]|nr:purine permease [Ruminococcaceae bacterium OttesenSCG-928-A16]